MRWSIGAKIGSGFAVALLVLIVVGSVAYRSLTQTEAARMRVEYSHKVIATVESLLLILSEAEAAQRGFAITGDERFLQPYQGAQQTASALITDVRSITTDDQAHRQRITALAPLVTEKFEWMRQNIETRRQSGIDAAIALIATDEGRVIMNNIRAIITEIKEDEVRRLSQRAAEESRSILRTKLTILLGILGSLVLVGVVGVIVTRDISGPLGQVSAAAQRVASGDIAASLPPTDRTDEVGVLVQTFNRMTEWIAQMSGAAGRIAAGDLVTEVKPQSAADVLGTAFATMRDSLRRSTGELQEAANVLAASASEILAASTQVAATAAETATAVAETTTTVEEVKQTAQVSSQKARLVSDAAQRATQTAQMGRQAVDAAIQGMQRVQEQMGSIAETVVKLSEQSQAIGEIVATVTDLADQSNLLAVNAAIEAARAGEQGKGFAVVAQEVKSLADQSKQATMQVRTILNDVQKAISRAVMATEQGDKIVQAGMGQSAAAADAIRSLAETIETGAQAALQIAASSQQQSIGMDQVASAMENIKQATNQNVSGTKQTEVAARNLHEVGQKLKSLVGLYRL
jgi:methyl-accepting chemotaxis protein